MTVNNHLKTRRARERTLGMSWCSLSASNLELNSLTLSLWVFAASLATLSASYPYELSLMLHEGRDKVERTLLRWTSSKRFSAAVFRSLLTTAGDARLLPAGEAVRLSSSFMTASSSFNLWASTLSSESFSLALLLDFFFLHGRSMLH